MFYQDTKFLVLKKCLENIKLTRFEFISFQKMKPTFKKDWLLFKYCILPIHAKCLNTFLKSLFPLINNELPILTSVNTGYIEKKSR